MTITAATEDEDEDLNIWITEHRCYNEMLQFQIMLICQLQQTNAIENNLNGHKYNSINQLIH